MFFWIPWLALKLKLNPWESALFSGEARLQRQTSTSFHRVNTHGWEQREKFAQVEWEVNRKQETVMSAKHLCFSEQPTLLEVVPSHLHLHPTCSYTYTGKKTPTDNGFLLHHTLKPSDKFHLLISYYCTSSLIVSASNEHNLRGRKEDRRYLN